MIRFTKMAEAPIPMSISLIPHPVLFLQHPDALPFSMKFSIQSRAFSPRREPWAERTHSVTLGRHRGRDVLGGIVMLGSGGPHSTSDWLCHIGQVTSLQPASLLYKTGIIIPILYSFCEGLVNLEDLAWFLPCGGGYWKVIVGGKRP